MFEPLIDPIPKYSLLSWTFAIIFSTVSGSVSTTSTFNLLSTTVNANNSDDVSVLFAM